MKRIIRQPALSLLVLSLLAVSVNAGEVVIPPRAPISNTQNGISAKAGDIVHPPRQSGYAEQLWFSLSGLLPGLF